MKIAATDEEAKADTAAMPVDIDTQAQEILKYAKRMLARELMIFYCVV